MKKSGKNDEFDGTTQIDFTKLNVTFELGLITNYDEATGDYYPFMMTRGMYLGLDNENVNVVVKGGTTE